MLFFTLYYNQSKLKPLFCHLTGPFNLRRRSHQNSSSLEQSIHGRFIFLFILSIQECNKKLNELSICFVIGLVFTESNRYIIAIVHVWLRRYLLIFKKKLCLITFTTSLNLLFVENRELPYLVELCYKHNCYKSLGTNRDNDTPHLIVLHAHTDMFISINTMIYLEKLSVDIAESEDGVLMI